MGTRFHLAEGHVAAEMRDKDIVSREHNISVTTFFSKSIMVVQPMKQLGDSELFLKMRIFFY